MAEKIMCKICDTEIYDALGNSNNETYWVHKDKSVDDHYPNPYKNSQPKGDGE